MNDEEIHIIIKHYLTTGTKFATKFKATDMQS